MTPDRSELGRYLEDTIEIDWQTPNVSAKAAELVRDCETFLERVQVR